MKPFQLPLRFSLRTLLIVTTLCAITCGGLISHKIFWIERVPAIEGSGTRVYVGSAWVGLVDFAGDERGTVLGAWWRRKVYDGRGAWDNRDVRLFEVEVGERPRLTGSEPALAADTLRIRA
jgi:hypothetical protein